MQAFLGRGDREIYWIFDVNGEEGERRAEAYFKVLRPSGGEKNPEE
jgi:hypothetical protein